jgi:hypothetical protein
MKMGYSIGEMPNKFRSEQLGRYYPLNDTLRLCAPLTPSQNILDGWKITKNYKKLVWFSKITRDHLRTQSLLTLGHFCPPWANFIELSIIRCGNRKIDPTNIIGGCKITIDALQTQWGGGKYKYIGCGIINNDDENHIKIISVENRKKDCHESLDVGTWLFIKRVM